MSILHRSEQPETLHPDLEQQLKIVGALISPSELHGHLCGRYVVGHHIEGAFGLRIVADYVDLSLAELEPVEEMVSQLIEQWVLVMDQDLFGFRLFLPDDEIALSLRLEQLASWTEGFLTGVGSTAGSDSDEAAIMKDERETLADLVEISKIDSQVDDNDENEALYAEVSEYVRLAAFNLFDRFRELAEKVAKEEQKADNSIN